MKAVGGKVVGAVLMAGVFSAMLSSPGQLALDVEPTFGYALPEPSLWAMIGVAIGAEACVGLRLVCGGGRRTHVAAVALLVVFSAFLIAMGVQEGWNVRCDCLRGIVEQSVVVGIIRNALLVGLLMPGVLPGNGRQQSVIGQSSG